MSIQLQLPEQFENLLNRENRSMVDSALQACEPILKDNKLVFFEEYTDHGIQHIEDVLYTSANLITPNAYKHLRSEDVTVLIIAVLLHDIGMHISSHGLNKILNGNYDQFRVSEFDPKTWRNIWSEFYHEAKRFNDEQLIQIFGKTDVSYDQPDPDNLNEDTKKLYGEFLRRYHHRLAHEIVLGGFPTIEGQSNISLSHPESNTINEVLNLSGLVARSHGMAIRDTFSYLKKNYYATWKNPFDINVVFLMVVLRVADYIQIQSERASSVLLRTKRFSSPVSQQEWEKHNSIQHISVRNEDPERIFVLASPDNSQIYLELEKLFKDIQYELDLSWAVLGEVYGLDDNLRNLNIKYRRIQSSLDDKVKFSDSVAYVPEKIRFNADPELLKLLIGPLYGEDPKYGVRELLQNSVDAIKERKYLEPDLDASLTVKIEKGEDDDDYRIVFTDNGIGMSKDTIINFFFRAGASFRKSMMWKKNFVEASHAQVQKTGRFGVGVLAIFLLGDDFEMTTRFINDDSAYYCKASLRAAQVELIKCNAEVGTSLSIRLKPEVIETIKGALSPTKTHTRRANNTKKLDWFSWYKFSEPMINYEIHESIQKAFNTFDKMISGNPAIPTNGWYSFWSSSLNDRVHWTIEKEPKRDYYVSSIYDKHDDETLFCNGFHIPGGYELKEYDWKKPSLSVFDSNARMPLSLNRDYLLVDSLPFESELVKSIGHTILDKLLKIEFDTIGKYKIPRTMVLQFPNWKIDLSHYVVVKKDEYTILSPFAFEESQESRMYQLWLIKNASEPKWLFKREDCLYQAIVQSSAPNYFYKSKIDSYHFDESRLNRWFGLLHSPVREELAQLTFLPNDKWLFMLEKNRLRKIFKSEASQKLFSDKWSVLIDDLRKNQTRWRMNQDLYDKHKKRRAKMSIVSKDIDTNALDSSSYYLVKEYFMDLEIMRNEEFLRNIWKEYLGEACFIPIDRNKRPKIDLS